MSPVDCALAALKELPLVMLFYLEIIINFIVLFKTE
jgi:hypothetical protein